MQNPLVHEHGWAKYRPSSVAVVYYFLRVAASASKNGSMEPHLEVSPKDLRFRGMLRNPGKRFQRLL